jgi:hypothetical protein
VARQLEPIAGATAIAKPYRFREYLLTMTFFAELKRRNVFRVAAAYAVIAWLLVEVSDTIFPRLGLPDWTVTFVIVLLLLGVPVSLFFAWAYELTPEGLRRERDVDPGESIMPQTGRRWPLDDLVTTGPSWCCRLLICPPTRTRNTSPTESPRNC